MSHTIYFILCVCVCDVHAHECAIKCVCERVCTSVHVCVQCGEGRGQPQLLFHLPGTHQVG